GSHRRTVIGAIMGHHGRGESRRELGLLMLEPDDLVVEGAKLRQQENGDRSRGVRLTGFGTLDRGAGGAEKALDDVPDAPALDLDRVDIRAGRVDGGAIEGQYLDLIRAGLKLDQGKRIERGQRVVYGTERKPRRSRLALERHEMRVAGCIERARRGVDTLLVCFPIVPPGLSLQQARQETPLLLRVGA